MKRNAKQNKKDNFFTLYSDIEAELKHYDFSGKTVYCNCDDGMRSNFFLYFMRNFEKLKLRKLICTGFGEDVDRVFIMYKKDYALFKPHDGDFKNNIDFLKESDVVVTNPPFSLFREYIALLVKYDKKFLVIGNVLCIGYKEIFPLIKQNKLWFGYKFNGKPMLFIVPDDYELNGFVNGYFSSGKKYVGVGGTCWVTNMENKKHNEYLILKKPYSPEKYLKYDNYDGINVDKVKNIPFNYYGIMGVPLTFLGKYNPKQFEIVGFRKGIDGKDLKIGGKYPFSRVLIRRVI